LILGPFSHKIIRMPQDPRFSVSGSDQENFKPYFLAYVALALLFTLISGLFSNNPILLSLAIPAQALNYSIIVPLAILLIVLFLDRRGDQGTNHSNLFGVFSLIIFAFLLFHSLYFSFIYDDAYISYRYVHNLLSGQGLVFNPGERVEAYSNLLWVIALAFCQLGLKWIHVNIPLTSILLSFASPAVIFWAARKYFKNMNFAHAPLYFLLLLSVNSFFAFWLYGGIETVPFSALLFLAYVLMHMDQKKYLPWVFSLIMLLRADGFVYFFIFVLCLAVNWAQKGKINLESFKAFLGRYWKILVVPVAVLSAQIAFRMVYYGYPLPNTFYAKVSAPFFAKIGTGWEYIFDFFELTFWLPVFIFALFIFMEKKITGKLLLSPFLLLTTLYVIYVGGDSLIQYRFMTHVIPLWLLMFVLSIEYLAQAIKIPKLKLIYIPLMCVFFFMGQHRLFISYKYQFKGWYPLVKKKLQYENMFSLGKYFQARYPRHSIALGAVGIIPYVANDMGVIDILGLADNHVAHLKIEKTDFHIGHNKWDIPYVLRRKPQIIIPPNYIFSHSPSEKEINKQDFLYGKDLGRADEFVDHYRPEIIEINGSFYLFYLSD
jgi:arabinofuranosyltransferase